MHVGIVSTIKVNVQCTLHFNVSTHLAEGKTSKELSCFLGPSVQEDGSKNCLNAVAREVSKARLSQVMLDVVESVVLYIQFGC